MDRTPQNYINGFAKLMNEVSGGDEATRGWVDMQPRAWRYVFNILGGGTGRTIERMAESAGDLFGGELPPTHQIPIVRRYMTNPGNNVWLDEYYDFRDLYRSTKHREKVYADSGNREGVAAMRAKPESNPAAVNMLNASEKKLRVLRTQMAIAEESGNEKRIKRINEQQTETMRRTVAKFNEVLADE